MKNNAGAAGPSCNEWWWLAPWLVALAFTLGALSRAWYLAPDLGHGWAAVILMGYLWWERWDERPVWRADAVVAPRVRWAVVLAALLLVPAHLVLTPYPLWPLAVGMHTAIAVGVLGLLASAAAGGAGLHWCSPLLLLPAVMPWPSFLDEWLILPLRVSIATMVGEVCNGFGLPALASGTSLQVAGAWVGVDEACGGIRSLQASVLAALFFGEWLRLRWTWRVTLILAGAVAAAIGNFGRVLLLTWAASRGELEHWHDPAGWLALGGSLVAVGLLAWVWRRKTPPVATVQPVRAKGAVAGGVARLTGALALWLVVVEAGTWAWYAHGASTGAVVPQWTVRWPEKNPTLRTIPLPDAAREMLRPDEFTSAMWLGGDRVRRNANFIVWTRGQVARTAAVRHNPTRCLPMAGCTLEESLGEVQVPWAHGTIPFQAYVFRHMNEEMVVAFTVWDLARGEPMAHNPSDWWTWRMMQLRDVLEARRDQPAQLLSFAIVGREHIGRLKEELAGLIVAEERTADASGG